MKTAYIIGAIILASGLAAGVMTWPRLPWVRAWKTRRTEKRILARPGPMPSRDRITLLPGEAAVFRMITDAEWAPDPKSFRWVTSALKASQKARRP